MINVTIHEKNVKTFILAFLADISVFLANYFSMFNMFDFFYIANKPAKHNINSLNSS